jgi:clan AA aspartic protease (TIGR02281 family)
MTAFTKHKIALTFLMILVHISPVSADIVYLKNGRSMECVVKVEGKDSVELEVEVGTIRLRMAEISRIERFVPLENEVMLQKWQARKVKADIARKAWQEAENIRQEQERQRRALLPKEVDTKVENGHMIVKARINNAVTATLLVDTGASVIVLSRAVGEKLGLVTTGDTPDNKRMNKIQLTVADGRKVEAKYVLLDSVRVQDAEASQIEAALMLDSKAEVLYDGVLGMSFLKRFNVGFNNKESKLILEQLK